MNRQRRRRIPVALLLGKVMYFVMMFLVTFHVLRNVTSSDGKHDLLQLFFAGIFLLFCLFFYLYSFRVANNDSLTGLPIKDQIMPKLVMLGVRNKLCMYAGMFVNIKNFKRVNQVAGSGGGNEALKFYATRMRRYLIRGEYIARLGGDNFVVVIFKHRVDDFMKMLDDIYFEYDTSEGKKKVKIESRCGIYYVKPKDSAGDLLDKASIALGYARQNPTLSYAVYTGEMQERLDAENEVVYNFYSDIREGKFKVMFLPKINYSTGELVGGESLARWEKDGKMLAPAEFLDTLERKNLVIQMDFYIFDQVCRYIKLWKDKGLKPVRVTSYFSKQHFGNPNLANDIVEIINKYGIDYSLIEIELTESSTPEDFPALKKFVECMNDLKISTIIDDFGIGYSTISLLGELSVDGVKMDKRFINGIEENDGDNTKFTLLKNVVRLCHEMGKKVVCEGVENRKQAELLDSIGCHDIQGFLFDRPLTPDEYENRLNSPIYDK